ncbi:MAG: type VI secretion system-associated FHA domain protein TagH [Pseudomonas sp.]
MELVFELLKSKQPAAKTSSRHTFTQAGGVIGRHEDCDWIIPDEDRHLSKRHALVSYLNGAFFLTDVSRNGIRLNDSGAYLRKGQAQRIEQGSVFRLGEVEIRARVVHDAFNGGVEIGRAQAAASTIPDDAFIDLDPLSLLDEQERLYTEFDALAALDTPHQDLGQHPDFARIDTERLLIPELVVQPEAAVEAEQAPIARQRDDFWTQFGEALGVDLNGLDHDGREALAINAAQLLKHSISGLQQGLRTRNELKNELRLALSIVQGRSNNPLKYAQDASEVLESLLRASKPGQLSAEQAILEAWRDLQAHQVALLAASRAALRGALEHFSPQQLTLRLERQSKPLLTTAGSRWKAYKRYHQALRQDDDWSERLLARDFALAYEEQIRLIGSLHTGVQG